MCTSFESFMVRLTVNDKQFIAEDANNIFCTLCSLYFVLNIWIGFPTCEDPNFYG